MKASLKIFLYRGFPSEKINYKTWKSFLESLIPNIYLELREDFFLKFLTLLREKEPTLLEISRALAASRIINPLVPVSNRQPLPGEISFERKYLLSPYQRPIGILYDAWELQKIMRTLIPAEERNWENLHLVITSQLFGTWDEKNRRYHKRTVFLGLPSIISISGLIEAPAKPRDFYLKLQMGIPRQILLEEFRDNILDYEDPRLTEVLKGYLLQALFYHLTGEAFCSDRSCRLYNAHWQEEMIRAQCSKGIGLCPYHLEIIEQFSKGKIKDEWLFKF